MDHRFVKAAYTSSNAYGTTPSSGNSTGFQLYNAAPILVNSGAEDKVTVLVKGYQSTWGASYAKDFTGSSYVPQYSGDTVTAEMGNVNIMTYEELSGGGWLVTSGCTFFSNYDIKDDTDYVNKFIVRNIIRDLTDDGVAETITPISTVKKITKPATETGDEYTIEGYVTSNASAYDQDTAFFDCIYIQDETGGINCFPVAGDFKIGDRVRVSGTTSSYQGERQLAVTKIEKIGEGTPVQPKVVTATQVNDLSVLGQLITLKGHVTAIEMAEGKVQTILVKDADGKVARVFIDGYICSDTEVKDLKVGCEIAATGLASYDNTFVLADGTAIAPRIRISNRADVVCTACTCGESGGDTPKTGDSAHMVLWVSMMTVTALAGAAMVLTKKRRS